MTLVLNQKPCGMKLCRLHLSKNVGGCVTSQVKWCIAFHCAGHLCQDEVNDFKVNIFILEDFSTLLLEIVNNHVAYLSGKRCHMLLAA